MKAARINEYGDSSKITISEVERPQPKDGQVLVEVYASSINPFDITIREGRMKDAIPLDLPITLGGDLAGVVTDLWSGVEGLAVGDNVYGQAHVVAGNSGAFAEFAATKSSQLARMPKNLDYNQSAAIPLVGASVLQALYEHLNLQPDQKIFIHGGAGGIGSIAVQVAHHLGAYVATTATGDQIDFVKQLGGDEVVDYKTQDFATVVTDFDAVFDTVGGDDFSKSFTVLKRGGTAVSMIAPPDAAKAEQLGITAMMQQTHVTTSVLDKLRELIEAGVITPQVSKVFDLNQIQAAFTEKETGMTTGKIVIQIK
jgi:NADPH:quinone reductase-like Zn-dependent oxidoreductase